MLNHLIIKNFVLIENHEIIFHEGMTVLTGETGAGKSILLDAVLLAIGDRADSKCIRHGAERCEITALFDISRLKEAQQWLKEHSLESEEQECILRRILQNDGKSRAYINGQLVSVSMLREIGALLIDIHGQHEHQTLLKRSKQLALLDEFSDNQTLCQQLSILHQQWQNLQQKKLSLSSQQEKLSQKDFFEHQLQELEAHIVSPEKLSELEQEHKSLANMGKGLQQIESVLQFIDNPNETDAQRLTHLAQQAFADLYQHHPKLQNAYELLSNAAIQLDECANDLRHFLEHADMSGERLQELEIILDKIYQLARKHRVKPQDLPAIFAKLKEEWQALNHLDDLLIQIEQEEKQLRNDYQKIVNQLSKKRQQAANKLSKAITDMMQKLNMSGGHFEIAFTRHDDQELHLHGQEKIDFMVSANPGQPLQTLAKTASGGELSRISLAIQVILAKHCITPTLIFDEVDAGVGGQTAAILGQMLHELGKHNQVMCVTHLPQVAAFANHHYRIFKTNRDKQTITHINKLVSSEREQEIARMLGGIEITAQTLAHAKEMLVFTCTAN